MPRSEPLKPRAISDATRTLRVFSSQWRDEVGSRLRAAAVWPPQQSIHRHYHVMLYEAARAACLCRPTGTADYDAPFAGMGWQGGVTIIAVLKCNWQQNTIHPWFDGHLCGVADIQSVACLRWNSRTFLRSRPHATERAFVFRSVANLCNAIVNRGDGAAFRRQTHSIIRRPRTAVLQSP